MAAHDLIPSILSVFERHVIERTDDAALLFVRNGETVTRTWGELGDEVHRCAGALEELGVVPGDRVVQWSANRCEWLITDLALQAIRAIHVPLHAALSGRQAIEQILHCGASLIILEGREQWMRLMPHQSLLPAQLILTSYDPVRRLSHHSVGHLREWTDRVGPERGAESAQRTLCALDPQDVMTVLYTSGTTGQPKGIALSYQNIYSNAKTVVQSFGDQPLEMKVCFLPLSHIFGRTCDLYTWVVRGSRLALVQSRETIIADCQRFRPTWINGVPYFYQRVHQKLVEKSKADQPGILQHTLGGDIRACSCGGGALDDATCEFFARHDIPLLQGYGLTETSPVISFNLPDAHKPGTVGRPIAGVEVQIASDGEVLTRGPHVMLRYWRDEPATHDTIRNGWLHTGDLGTLDVDGFLRITGRKKEMIKTATGKNVFPAHLETLLCRDPFILQALVVGDDRKCLAALIVPDPDVLRAEIRRRRLWVWGRRSAVRHPQIRALYRECIDRQLAELSPHEQVGYFRVLDRGFTIESGHLTPKLSLRREQILQDFAREIDALYHGNH